METKKENVTAEKVKATVRNMGKDIKSHLDMFRNKLSQRVEKREKIKNEIIRLNKRINLIGQFLSTPDQNICFEEFLDQKGIKIVDFLSEDLPGVEKHLNCILAANGENAWGDHAWDFEDGMEDYLENLENREEELESEYYFIDADIDKINFALNEQSGVQNDEMYFSANAERRAARKAAKAARKAARQKARADRKKAKAEWKAAGKPGGRKAFRAKKKEIRKEKKAIQRANAGFVRKVWNLNKKATVAPNRMAFLGVLAVNTFNMAYKIRLLMESKNAEDQKRWQKIQDVWKWTFGGNPAKLKSVAIAGSKKKAIKKKAELEAVQDLKRIRGVDGEIQLYDGGATAISALITLAASVITAITPFILSKVQGSKAPDQEVGGEAFDSLKSIAKEQAKNQIYNMNISDEAKSELIKRLEAGEAPEAVTYDALDESHGEGLGMKEYALIGGGIILGGIGLYYGIKALTKKSK